MKFEKIDNKTRVWVVTRGPDGRLTGEMDRELLSQLEPGLTAEEIDDAVAIAAGKAEVAHTRLW